MNPIKNPFDFDRDGEMDAWERATECAVLEELFSDSDDIADE